MTEDPERPAEADDAVAPLPPLTQARTRRRRPTTPPPEPSGLRNRLPGRRKRHRTASGEPVSPVPVSPADPQPDPSSVPAVYPDPPRYQPPKATPASSISPSMATEAPVSPPHADPKAQVSPSASVPEAPVSPPHTVAEVPVSPAQPLSPVRPRTFVGPPVPLLAKVPTRPGADPGVTAELPLSAPVQPAAADEPSIAEPVALAWDTGEPNPVVTEPVAVAPEPAVIAAPDPIEPPPESVSSPRSGRPPLPDEARAGRRIVALTAAIAVLVVGVTAVITFAPWGSGSAAGPTQPPTGPPADADRLPSSDAAAVLPPSGDYLLYSWSTRRCVSQAEPRVNPDAGYETAVTGCDVDSAPLSVDRVDDTYRLRPRGSAADIGECVVPDETGRGRGFRDGDCDAEAYFVLDDVADDGLTDVFRVRTVRGNYCMSLDGAAIIQNDCAADDPDQQFVLREL